MTCSTKIRLRKATTITGTYAAFDLGQKTVRAVLKRQDGKIVNELKIKKQADSVLKFLKGTNANVVMESGYNPPISIRSSKKRRVQCQGSTSTHG
ncbi:MAG: hypothetical protein WCC17_05215 [Candidatus Nitrosopolaris sp.]